MAIALRPYQQKCIDSVITALRRGVKRPAVVLATGGGKTVVFSHLIPKLPTPPGHGSKVLVLAHRVEIIHQARRTISSINPSLNVGTEMAAYKADVPYSDVITASVSLLFRGNRLEKYDPTQFKAIIVDECHHAAADSWRKVLHHFGADTDSTSIPVIGFTATFMRSDDKSLRMSFDEIVFQKNLPEMIEEQHLTDIKFHTIKLQLALDEISTSDKTGDFEEKDLEKIMSDSRVITDITALYLNLREHENLKRTLVFCSLVAHCKNLCASLQRSGVNAQYVTGNTNRVERQAIIDDFESGVVNVLVNFGIFTEGTDIPNIDSIIIARPTRLRALLTQMVGRGLRKYPGKNWCHLIDIADTMGTGFQSVPALFLLPTTYDMDGKDSKSLYERKKTPDDLADRLDHLLLTEQTEKQVEEMLTADKWRDMSFLTLEGIKNYQHGMADYLKTSDGVSEAFRRNVGWIRISNTDWAKQTSEMGFYRIRWLPTESEFTLSKCTLHTAKFRSQRRFKVERYVENESVLTTKNLEELFALTNMGYREWHKNKYPATRPQIDFVLKRMSKFIPRRYSDPEAMAKLHDAWSKSLTRGEVESMIFALNVSEWALYPWWQVQRVLGLTAKQKKTQTSWMKRWQKESQTAEKIY